MKKLITLSPLFPEVHSFLENLANANGIIYHINAHLNDYAKIYKKGARGNSAYEQLPISSNTLYIVDISEPKSNSRPIIYDYGFVLYLDEIDNRFESHISRIAMRELAYCYDIFETFLKDITAKFLLLNSEKYTEELKLILSGKSKEAKEYKEDLNLENIRYKLRNLTHKGNNELFELIRKVCPQLARIETENSEDINLIDWFKVYTQVRHSIIHSNFIIKSNDYEKMSTMQRAYLKKYFLAQEQANGRALKMNVDYVRDNVELIANYGIQIFKNFCLVGGYEWKVFDSIKEV